MNNYIEIICKLLKNNKIEYQTEYKFLKNRKFRFDIAIVKYKIAIEFEGGVWIAGRHTRGYGYINDIEKYNYAVLNGWKLLRYTAENFKNNKQYLIIEDIKNLIKQIKEN